MDREQAPSWLRTDRGEQLQTAMVALSASARRRRRQIAAAVRAGAVALVAPWSVIVALLVAGTTLGIAGVHTLWGPGWAMLAGGGFAFTFAALIARGAGNE